MIDLTEDGDNFVLKSALPDGSGSSVPLSSGSYDVDPIVSPLMVATRTTKIGVHIDALGKSILLSVTAPNGSKVTYALSQNISLELSKQLPIYVSQLGNKGAPH
jgi:hypothetical protein